jgi:hypothetical protein
METGSAIAKLEPARPTGWQSREPCPSQAAFQSRRNEKPPQAFETMDSGDANRPPRQGSATPPSPLCGERPG